MTNAVSRDQGFLTVPDVLQPAEVATLRAEVVAMRGGRAGVRHVLTNPVVRRIAEDPRLVVLHFEYAARVMLGDGIELAVA